MDLDLLLRETADVADPTDAVIAAGRVRLDEAARRQTLRVAALARSRRRRRPVVGVGAVAAAATALVVVPTVAVHGPPASSAAAAGVLRQAGRSAAQQPGGWPDAPYWHVVEQEQRGAKVATREVWLGHDRTGALVDPLATDEGTATVELTPAAFLAAGIGWDALYRLPTDPDTLATVLSDQATACGCGPDHDTEVFDQAVSALDESPASPALRAALWEVASRVPGTRLVGPATDALGRHGTAIQREDETYVVDPGTGMLLQWVGAGHGVADGRPVTYGDGVGFRYTYLSQGPAETAPAAQVPTGSGAGG